MILAIIVFLGILVFSAFEQVHRTVAALAGAGLILVSGILTQEEAIRFIDFNTIGLIIGVMFLINISKRSGIFRYLAIKATKLVKADPVSLLFVFPILAGVMAAFMDAVTAALLLAPIIFLICSILNIESFPYFLAVGIAVNIGGTATMVGDPPNVMIGSAANLSFMDFIINVAPVSIFCLILQAFVTKWIFKKRIRVQPELQKYLMSIDENKSITNTRLAALSSIVFLIVILAFMFHKYLNLEVATISIAGAAALLFVTKTTPHEIFEESDFLTVFFFIGLFISVGALEKTGVISFLSGKIFILTEGHPLMLALTILWFSAFASAIVDNIPLVACMIPLIKSMPAQSIDIQPLWYALSLGACLGGNGTLIGASSNMVLAGIAEKFGERISFMKFTRYGMPLMICTIIICSFYIALRYY